MISLAWKVVVFPEARCRASEAGEAGASARGSKASYSLTFRQLLQVLLSLQTPRWQPVPLPAMTSLPLQGSCSCGKVSFEATAEPLFYDHCHCHSCRIYHCAPFISSLGFARPNFSVTKGSQNLFKVNITPQTDRYSCSSCRTPVYNIPTQFDGVIISFPMLFEKLDLKPQYHIWVRDAVFPEATLKDGLPRYPEWPPMS